MPRTLASCRGPRALPIPGCAQARLLDLLGVFNPDLLGVFKGHADGRLTHGHRGADFVQPELCIERWNRRIVRMRDYFVRKNFCRLSPTAWWTLISTQRSGCSTTLVGLTSGSTSAQRRSRSLRIASCLDDPSTLQAVQRVEIARQLGENSVEIGGANRAIEVSGSRSRRHGIRCPSDQVRH